MLLLPGPDDICWSFDGCLVDVGGNEYIELSTVVVSYLDDDVLLNTLWITSSGIFEILT